MNPEHLCRAIKLAGRDRFDTRKDIIRTLYEGALLITSTDLRRDKNNNVYALYKDGSFQWVMNQDNNGISNYDENADLTPYWITASRSLEGFIDQKLEEQDTVGFMAMDRPSLFALMKRKESLDQEYLMTWGIGIRKK